MPEFLKLVIIRHAQSTGNVDRRMQGQGDYPLTDLGRTQAQKLAQHLQDAPPTAIYSSPLQRTIDTTEILRAKISRQGLPAAPPIQLTPELAEYQNGIFQGLTWAEAQAQYPELCHQLATTADWIPVPGAETLRQARDRVERLIDYLLLTHCNGDRLWLVSHGWIMQQFIAALLGSDRSWRIHVQNTALFEFWIDQSRWHRGDENRLNTDLWQIVRFNDVSHLQTP
jgi:2,3-bisphosphoglycerate-dependent phosphoglycerate mutase